MAMAPHLNHGVVRLALTLLILGYGTKVGLAPTHSWLADAHSQAPAPVSALMSGVLLTVAFYALLRCRRSPTLHSVRPSRAHSSSSWDCRRYWWLLFFSSRSGTSRECWHTPVSNTWDCCPWRRCGKFARDRGGPAAHARSRTYQVDTLHFVR